MNRSLAFEFLLYGLLLAGVSWFIQRAAPDFGRITLIAGLAGGAISVLWGVLALCGYRRRWWIILTLAAVGFTLLSQTVIAWMQPTGWRWGSAHTPGRGVDHRIAFVFLRPADEPAAWSGARG